MDASSTRRIRVRHALRCAVGGASIAALALSTAATSGCTPLVVFFISTIAGTPENLQGFQLRCASLTFVGAVLGAVLYTVVAAITATSSVATFFVALPMIAFLSALRPEKDLVPMPAVANVYLGFLIISRFGDPRHVLLKNLAAFLAEAAIGWAAAILVNTVLPPDRAGALGRHIIALELRRMGAIISDVGTKTFSRHNPAQHNPDGASHVHTSDSPEDTDHFTMFLEEGIEENAVNSGLLQEDYVFLTAHLPSRIRRQGPSLAHTAQMIRAAERSLTFMQDLRPSGRTRVSDYASLARAAQLFEASAYEPQLLPEAASRWRNVRAWNSVIENMRAVVNKVSSLESVSVSERRGSVRFSKKLMLQFFGEAYFPLWICHYASCAAACAKMSTIMCKATCKDMFHLPEVVEQNAGGVDKEQESGTLDWTIDPSKWNARKADMYFGFLLRYRLGLRNFARDTRWDCRAAEKQSDLLRSLDVRRSFFHRSSDRDDVRGAENAELRGIRRSISLTDMNTLQRGGETLEAKRTHKDSTPMRTASSAEIQALSFFAITSNALSEEISHVQHSMTALASSSDARGLFAPFYFLVSGLPALWHRINALVRGQVEEWEVRFVLTHSMLLSSILALALFLPIEGIEASEIAWVFTSAALAAQLSAEPTLFIGTIRVVATLTGGALSFGFSSILEALDRSANPGIQYATIPYIFVITIACLLLVPTSFRYAAFLIAVTNAVLLFCPRSTPECTQVLAMQSAECFPDWKYALSRAANVSIGVVFALFFHLVFWPRFANQVALRNLSTAFINASRLFGKLHRTYFTYGLDDRSESSEVAEEMPPKQGDVLFGEQDTVFAEDVYKKDTSMLGEIQQKVGEPLSSAMLIVKSEAGVWRTGPLRLYPLIPRVLCDFVALTVSLVEMASILGRRPVFSPSYGRSVFEHYILPMLDTYETIQVSLLNLVGITDRTVANQKAEALRDNSLDLHHAITHLARIRGELRQDAERRSHEFKKFSALALSHRKPCRFSGPGESADESFADLVHEHIGKPGQRLKPKHPRARSHDGMTDNNSHSSYKLCVDDVVLYDAFTFITDGCLSAFVRIAVAVLIESQSQLKDLNKKRK